MITLELTLVDHMTGRDAESIFLVGDRFTVTTRNMQWGETEREVTVINDGLCRHDGYFVAESYGCLLYTSPSPRDGLLSRMPSSA